MDQTVVGSDNDVLMVHRGDKRRHNKSSNDSNNHPATDIELKYYCKYQIEK